MTDWDWVRVSVMTVEVQKGETGRDWEEEISKSNSKTLFYKDLQKTDRQTETKRQTDRQTDRHRQTDRQRQRERETETD